MRNAVKRNWIHWAKGLAKDPEDPRMHLPRATKSGRSSTGVPGCLDECHELSVLTCSGQFPCRIASEKVCGRPDGLLLGHGVGSVGSPALTCARVQVRFRLVSRPWAWENCHNCLRSFLQGQAGV